MFSLQKQSGKHHGLITSATELWRWESGFVSQHSPKVTMQEPENCLLIIGFNFFFFFKALTLKELYNFQGPFQL